MRVNLYKPGVMRAPLICEAAARCKLYSVLRKISYDAETAAIAAKVFTPGYSPDYITGLINLATGQMYLKEQVDHGTMAVERHLRDDERHLKPNWYGFTMGYRSYNNHHLAVSPDSGRFGGIPIEFAPIFEASIRELFSGQMGDRDRIFFYQDHYQRGISRKRLIVLRDSAPVAAA